MTTLFRTKPALFQVLDYEILTCVIEKVSYVKLIPNLFPLQ